MSNCLVVASNRPERIPDFLKAWEPHRTWNEFILVEDNQVKSNIDFSNTKAKVYHFSWQQIEDELKENSWIISTRDSSIKSYGFYYAVRKLYCQYIFCLDDDCYPIENEYKEYFSNQHIDAINNTNRWIESVPGYRTRGIPYKKKGYLDNVVLNMGLWENIPDYDSIQQLNIIGGNKEEKIVLPNYNRIVPKGQYFPLCGMNMCFTDDIAPAMYFMLMGDGQQYRRFDDIWGGIVIKKICDHLNLNISIGKPFIEHKRASDPFVNLIKESHGIILNETFWQTIDKINLTKTTVKECMYEIGSTLCFLSDDYMPKLGEAMKIWSKLF